MTDTNKEEISVAGCVSPIQFGNCQKGSKGPKGATGATGATGITGPTGSGSIISYASGLPIAVVTTIGGIASTGGLVGFGNSVSGVSVLGGVIDLTGGVGILNNFAFSSPRSGTVTSIAGYFSIVLGLNLLGGSAFVRFELWSADPTSATPNAFSPTGVFVELPAFTGILSIGDVRHAIAPTALLVTPETRLLLVVTVRTTGLALVTILTGYASAGITIT